MGKQNCWEYFDCERRADDAVGSCCPAVTEEAADGINGGRNGGRACWALAQTLCGGKVQGSISEKMIHCMKCDFRKQVVQEEQAGLINFREILERLKEKENSSPF